MLPTPGTQAIDDHRPAGGWTPYLLVAVVWILTRAFPLSQAVPWTFWDVWEARKLLDYGFWHRFGAIIDIHYMAGLVPNPWRFNYVNHPYPILWANTLAYYVGGQWAALLFNSAIGLAGCLAVYPALRYFYSEKQALWGAILFTLVPINVIFNVNPDLSGVAASFWVFTVWGLAAARSKPTEGPLVLLGVTVFLSGQVSWSTYSFYPLLLLGASGLAWERSRGFVFDARSAVMKSVLVGILLTGLVFLLQIIFYTPDWSELTAYIGRQAGSDEGVTIPKMYLAILLRAALSIGPVLVIGSLAFLASAPRLRRLGWLQLSALIYPLFYVCCALILRRYFYRERHLYCYLAFPLLILVLETLRSSRSRVLTGAVAGLAVAGLSYPIIQATIPVASETSRQLGQKLQSMTKPQQVIVTNLIPQRFPFAPWDIGGLEMTTLAADRNLRPGINTRAKLDALLLSFKSQRLEILYLLAPEQPVDAVLLEALDESGAMQELHFILPAERLSLALRLRNFYWHLTRKRPEEQTNAGQQEAKFRIGHRLLERDSEGVIRLSEQAGQ